MKAAHISPTYYSADSVLGGGERYVIYFCKAMREGARNSNINIQLSLFAFGDKIGTYEIEDGIRCTVLPGVPWDPNSLNSTSLKDALKDFSIIFVHQCLSAFGLFVASQAKICGKIVIGLDHGGGEHELVPHTPEVGDIFDLFIAYSEFGLRNFLDLNGRVDLIRGPVDDYTYQPDASERVRNDVMAVGRLLPHKGFDRIISALPDGMKLRIFGAPYDAEYRTHLERCAASKNVEFFYSATDAEVMAHLHRAGVFVHASTHLDYRGTYYAKPELLGLAPLEALACGIPTLVSSAGALPELSVVHGCECFVDDDELSRMLRGDVFDEIVRPHKSEIYKDLKSKFGLFQFGCKLISILIELQSQ